MPKRKAEKGRLPSSSNQQLLKEICYEGERLDSLLQRLKEYVEAAKLSKGSLPEKFWVKRQFAIGVNDVTRVLERMAPVEERPSTEEAHHLIIHDGCKGTSIKLQAVLLASNCNPRWLIKHLPSLALSRRVPIVFVEDDRQGSLRLGEVVKLKTAMALGVKANVSRINKFIEDILHQYDSLRSLDANLNLGEVNAEGSLIVNYSV